MKNSVTTGKPSCNINKIKKIYFFFYYLYLTLYIGVDEFKLCGRKWHT